VRLSSRTRYGARALFDLAYHTGGAPTCVRDIAERQDIPARFLEQVLADLKRAGLVESRRGARGGYVLSRDPAAITLGQVLRAIEGIVSFGQCVHTHDGEVLPGQHVSGRCVTGEIWQNLGSLMTDFLDRITVEDLCTRGGELGIVAAVEALPILETGPATELTR
jgi:Rrf2 family protein